MQPDRDQLAQFVDALFRYAEEGSFVSLRAFHETRRDVPPIKIEAVKVNGDASRLVDRAEAIALLAANHGEPAVFAPPVAVFSSATKAREADLAAALAAACELDHDAQAGLERLRGLMGPPTVVVESGGEWAPGNPKLHAYWRYSEPAEGKALHDSKALRIAMLTLVGGDPTNGPDSHPIRWPGSWHRKGEPRLCRIVEYNPDAEIDLGDMLDAVIVACKAEDKSPRKVVANGSDRPVQLGEIDTIKFVALQEMSDIFRKAWRERFFKEDGTTPDHSKCDWHIAMEACRAGWADEEIAALLAAFRRHVGEADKATPQYLGRTIRKIRDALKGGGETHYEPDIAEAEKAAEGGDKEGTLAALSNRLGVKLAGFIVIGRDGEPTSGYVLKVANGTSINVGTAGDLLSHKVVKNKLLAACGVVLRGMKQHEWDAVVSLMLSAADREDPADSDPVVQIRAALDDYLATDGKLPEWEDEEASIAFFDGTPLIRGGAEAITIAHFLRWLNASGFRWTGDEARTLLRLAGWNGSQYGRRIDGASKKKWYWSAAPVPVVPEENQ